MSDGALFLIYSAGGVIAFIAVYLFRWRIPHATLLGTVTSLAIYLIATFERGANFDDPWFEIALIINGTFSLVLALGGAIGAKGLMDIKGA